MGSGTSISNEEQVYINKFVKAVEKGDTAFVRRCLTEHPAIVSTRENYSKVSHSHVHKHCHPLSFEIEVPEPM